MTYKSFSFSIGVPTCNRPIYLRQALLSCLAQTVLPLEVIVVNDGGAPESNEVIEEIGSSIIRCCNIPPSGRPVARNRILSECRGDYLIWLDDDDALLPWCIESHIETIRDNPGTDVSYGHMILCDANLNPRQVAMKRVVNTDMLLYEFFRSNPIPNPSTAVSARCLAKVGQFDHTLLRAQDYDHYVRALYAGAKFTHVNMPLCLYRSHPNNAAVRSNAKKHTEFPARVMMKMLERNGIRNVCPWLDWQADTAGSLVVAVGLVCQCFMKLGALDKVKAVLASHRLPADSAQKHNDLYNYYVRVVEMLGIYEPKMLFKQLGKDLLFFNPMVQELVWEYVDFHLDSVEADKLRADWLLNRVQVLGAMAVYSDIPDVGEQAELELAVRLRLAGDMIRFNQVDSAIAVACDEAIVTSRSSFYRQMLANGSPLTGELMRQLSYHKDYYRPESQELLASLGANTLHRLQRELEEHLATGSSLSDKGIEHFRWDEGSYLAARRDTHEEASMALEAAQYRFEEAVNFMSQPNNAMLFRHSSLDSAEKVSNTGYEKGIYLDIRDMSAKPILSVIVADVGRPRKLEDTLWSIVKCVGERCEVIVMGVSIDRLSPDLIAAVADAGVSLYCLQPDLQHELPSCSRYCQDFQTTGWHGDTYRPELCSRLFNFGAQEARGSWLMFVPAGSIVLSDVSELLDSLKESVDSDSGQGVGVFYAPRYYQTERFGFPVSHQAVSTAPVVYNSLIQSLNQIVSGAFAVRRDIFMDSGGYRHDLGYIADHYLLVCLARFSSARRLSKAILVERVEINDGFTSGDRLLGSFTGALLSHAALSYLYSGLSQSEGDSIRALLRVQAYGALERYLRSGGVLSIARAVVQKWHQMLGRGNLSQEQLAKELSLDRLCLERACPQVGLGALKAVSDDSGAALSGGAANQTCVLT